VVKVKEGGFLLENLSIVLILLDSKKFVGHKPAFAKFIFSRERM